MKFLARHNAPRSLGEWKRRETVPENLHYDGSLPTAVKDDIRGHRVTDQAGLCAYTMREIPRLADDNWDAHVEHLVPRSVSRTSGNLEQTVDYRNMVACVNRAANLPYGASVRGDKPLRVTPLVPGCERRFRFSLTGNISAANPNDADAKATIEALKLDHTSLDDMRRSAMAARGLAIARTDNPTGRRLRPAAALSATAARRLAAQVLMPNPNGRCAAFCVAISQAALEHAERVERHSRILDFARRGVE
jgi:uncharacterized protein (TIGR02646 family)